jgi:CRP/FNR family cyclic AMP-dependent transcriptional regulator
MPTAVNIFARKDPRKDQRGVRMARKAKATFNFKVFLGTVDHGRTISTYAKDEVIFRQGNPSDAVFCIRSGHVKIAVTSKQGREAVIAILGAGQFFGEGCLAGQPVRLATARAVTKSEVMRVDKAEMVRLLHAEPAFSEIFMTYLLTRNSRVEEDLVDQLFNSSEKRLARTLLLLTNSGKDGAPRTVTPKISQETLAEIVGTTRPRVSALMSKFRKLGFIEYNGGLRIHSALLSVLRD